MTMNAEVNAKGFQKEESWFQTEKDICDLEIEANGRMVTFRDAKKHDVLWAKS